MTRLFIWLGMGISLSGCLEGAPQTQNGKILPTAVPVANQVLQCASTNWMQAGDVASLGDFGEPAGAYMFNGVLTGAPTPASGLHIIPKPWLDDFQYFPASGQAWSVPASPVLQVRAARGESEPVTAVLLAAQALDSLQIQISDFAGNGTTLTGCTEVRRVVRNFKREYPSLPKDTARLWNNWLPKWRATRLAPNEFREIWIQVQVPPGTPGGTYEASLAVSSVGQPVRRVPVKLTVRDFDLAEPHQTAGGKHLGAYWNFPAKLFDTDDYAVNAPRQFRQFRTELAELRARGIRKLYISEVGDIGLTILYPGADGEFIFDARRARRLLKALEDEGFDGTVVTMFPVWNYLLTGLVSRTDFVTARNAAGATTIAPKAVKAFDEMMKFYSKGYKQSVVGMDTPLCRQCNITLAGEIADEVQFYGNVAYMNRWVDFARQIQTWQAAQPADWPKVQVYNTVGLLGGNEASMSTSMADLSLLETFLNLPVYLFSVDAWVWYDNPARTSMAAVTQRIAARAQRAGHYAWYGGWTENPKYIRGTAGAYLWASPFQFHTTWGMHWATAAMGRWPGSPFNDSDHHCAAPYQPLTTAQVKAGAKLPLCDTGDWNLFGLGQKDDPTDLIPTRQWLARGEGADDLRYLTTLDQWIAKAPVGTVKDLAVNFRMRVAAMFRYEAAPAALPGATVGCEIDLSLPNRATTPADGVGGGSLGNAVMSTIAGRVAYTRLSKAVDWDCLRESAAAHISKIKALLEAPKPRTSWKLDFGTATSPVAEGYTRVTAKLAYPGTEGFGWASPPKIEERDRGVGDGLARDFNMTLDGTFWMNVPNGTYQVSVVVGDATYLHEAQVLQIQNNPMVGPFAGPKGSTRTITENATVTNGVLTIRTQGRGYNSIGVPNYGVVNAVTVTRVI